MQSTQLSRFQLSEYNQLTCNIRVRPHTQLFSTCAILTTAIILLAFASQVQATSLVYRSMRDLVSRAELITVATVSGMEARVSPAGEIFTFVTFSELLPIRGAFQQSQLTVRLPGGKVDEAMQIIPGAPNFSTGERLILFFKGVNDPRKMVPFVGWTQGIFRLNESYEVHDYDDTPVIGVTDQGKLNTVERQELGLTRTASKIVRRESTEIVALSRPPAQISAGIATEVVDPMPVPQDAPKTTLNLDAFKDLIARFAEGIPAPQITIRSLEVGDFPAALFHSQMETSPPLQKYETTPHSAVEQSREVQ